MAVLLKLYAAMTQSGFHDQIKPISLQYKNVGLGDLTPNHPPIILTPVLPEVNSFC